jgi:hypothetical protein
MKSRLLWTLGTVVLLASGAAALVLRPAEKPPAPVSAAPSFEAAPASLPKPSAGAPASEFQEWVTQEATAALHEQTAGLLAGDFDRFATHAQPGNTALTAELQRRFRTLRSLWVTRFDQRVDGQPFAIAGRPGSWRVVHLVDICFVETDCTVDEAVLDSEWKETATGVDLVALKVHDRDAHCFDCPAAPTLFTRPWETTELVAQVGERTLVAVPLQYRGRLADLSRRVEAAAALADRYKVGTGTVDRYRVFVADARSERLWYRGYPGTWVTGTAYPTARDRIEVELHADQLTPSFTDVLLRHELAHVSTLRSNDYYGRRDVWWLVEGMAEYVGQQAAGASDRANKAALHRFLSRHELSTVVITPPARDATNSDASGRYAVGYYALNCLFQRYGKEATLTFFQGAIHNGTGVDGASRSAFGKPWPEVDSTCTAQVRKA